MGIDAALCQLITRFQRGAVQHLNSGTVRNQVSLGFAGLVVGDNNLPLLLCIFNGRHTAELRDNRQSFRLTRLKKLLYTGKTLCDIVACHTAGMEGTHGKLCTGLTDGLRRNDADSLTDLNRLAGRHIRAVTLRADTHMGTAG